MMELKHWFEILSEILPSAIADMPGGVPQEFLDWMLKENRPQEFASQLFYTLPSPRYQWYEQQSYNSLQNEVLTHTNEVTKALSFFTMDARFDLLDGMKASSGVILFIGLVFNIMLI